MTVLGFVVKFPDVMPTLARPQELSSRVPSTSAVVRPVALT